MKTEDIKNIYNNIVPGKYKGDYEYNRWFKTPLLKAGYDMAKKSIDYHVLSQDNELHIKDYIEIGPGSGTWTKLFIEKYQDISFDVIDISGEMLMLAKNSLKKYNNIHFFENDFLQFKNKKQYDFLFSSRAIEYFPDKDMVVKKIYSILKNGGYGFVITKTPKYFLNKILGRKFSKMHQGQISHMVLQKILEDNGFCDIEIHPTNMSFPIFKSVFLNKILHMIFYKHEINYISSFFSESYCIKFKKNDY